MNHRVIISYMAILSVCAARAVIIAQDSAADPTYSSGWSSGQNGGFGFGAWSIYPSGGTFFVGDSNGNGSAIGPGINSSGRAWGLNSPVPGPTYPYFYRGITAAINVGDIIAWDVDTGTVSGFGVHQFAVGTIWIGLDGGATNYWFQDGSGRVGTTIAASDGGLHVEYQWTSANSATVRLTVLATNTLHTLTANAPISGYYGGQAIQSGDQPQNDMYFNNMYVDAVPEPSVYGLLCGTPFIAFLGKRLSIRAKS